MKKILTGIIAAFLAVCMVFSAVGCTKEREKTGLGYQIEQEKYLFGMGEVPADVAGGAMDSRVSMEMVADLCGELGVKSFRIWMHLTTICERDAGSDTVRLKADAVEKYQQFIDLLKENGVTHITAMNHYYLYPVGYSASAGCVVPDPNLEFEEYVRFMEMLRECYRLLAEAFPDVTYWEPSNETNGADGRFVAMNGFSEAEDADNSQYLFSEDDLAYITADMCWYANAGVKASNPDACTVLPGMIFNTNGQGAYATALFLQNIYDQIDSRYLPSGEEYADINPDNYFQVLNWHPYVGSWGMPDDTWVQTNKDIYAVAERNGDDGKKVFLTELGWQDQNVPENQDLIARAFIATIDLIKEELPWVETFHTFRMFNWDTAPLEPDSIERFFGLFTSPNSVQGASPKPVALALFHYFNGEEADASGLYKYAAEASTAAAIS